MEILWKPHGRFHFLGVLRVKLDLLGPRADALHMKGTPKNEWSRYYRLHDFEPVEALHARFVSHRYPRHVHDYFVIGLVENGAHTSWYRGGQHITRAGQI